MSKKNTKTEYHHGDLRMALIEEGINILSTKGLSALTFRALSRKLKVSHTAPYRHFKNRDDLIVTIAMENLKCLAGHIKETASKHKELSTEMIIDVMMTYHRAATNNPECVFLIFKILVNKIVNLKAYPEFTDLIQEYLKVLFKYVEEAQKKKLLVPGDPSFVCLMIWSAIHGITMLSIGNVLNTIVPTAPWKKDIDTHILSFLTESGSRLH